MPNHFKNSENSQIYHHELHIQPIRTWSFKNDWGIQQFPEAIPATSQHSQFPCTQKSWKFGKPSREFSMFEAPSGSRRVSSWKESDCNRWFRVKGWGDGESRKSHATSRWEWAAIGDVWECHKFGCKNQRNAKSMRSAWERD